MVYMRVIAIIMVLITVLVFAFLGYCYFGMQMKIVGVVATVTPAAEAVGTYNETLAQLENDTFTGTVYRETEFIMPDSFAFLTLQVRMQNGGVFPMDWISIEVEPDAADVLQMAQTRTPTLAANTRADFSTTLLTKEGAAQSRKVTVSYYVLGRKMTATYEMQ